MGKRAKRLERKAKAWRELACYWRRADLLDWQIAWGLANERDDARRWSAAWKRAASGQRALARRMECQRDQARARIAELEADRDHWRQLAGATGGHLVRVTTERNAANERIATLEAELYTYKAWNDGNASACVAAQARVVTLEGEVAHGKREYANRLAIAEEWEQAAWNRGERILLLEGQLATITGVRDDLLDRLTARDTYLARVAEPRIAALEGLLRRWDASFPRMISGPIHDLQEATRAALEPATPTPVSTCETPCSESALCLTCTHNIRGPVEGCTLCVDTHPVGRCDGWEAAPAADTTTPCETCRHDEGPGKGCGKLLVRFVVQPCDGWEAKHD